MALNGNDTHALYEQARARLERGNAAGAVEILELAVEQEPGSASLQETLGRAYFANANVRQAREAFERIVELDPTSDYGHFGLGRCLELQGHLSGAAKHFKLACALAPRQHYRRALDRVLQRLG